MTGPARAEDDPHRRGARVTDGVAGWTVSGSADDGTVLRNATDLLRTELDDPRLADDTAYLRWCYRDNPLGPAWERYHYVERADDDPLLVAHYVNIPRRYRGPAGARTEGAWSLHAVTRSGYQRARHFTRLGHEIYASAGADGRSFVAAVANAKSTAAVIKYLGFRLIGPLPVKVVSPVGPGLAPMSHTEATETWLGSSGLDDLAAMVDRHPATGWSTDWTEPVLRWRLGCPFTRYWVHVGEDMAMITTRLRYHKLAFTVILKVFALGDGPVRATAAIRSVTRWHRSAFAVYAGFNPSAPVRGITAPRRLQPSPLNLAVRPLAPALDPESITLDTFEFLDMDAY